MGIIEKVKHLALQTGFKGSVARDDYDEYDEYDDYDENDYDSYEYEEPQAKEVTRPSRVAPVARESARNTGARSTVLSIHTNVQMQVVISYPESVDEAGSICEYVKANKTVVVNLENVKHEMAQRIIDFLGGVSYALEGDIQYISNKIFLVAPKNVDISGHFKEELKANGILFNFKQSFK